MSKLIRTTFNILLFFSLQTYFVSAQVDFWEGTIDNNVHGVGGIYTCDLDDDLDIDVLGASLEDDQIIWWRNDGGNPIVWTKIIIGSNVGEAHSVYAADFDNDNDLDVVGAAYVGTPGIAYWRNDGGDPITWTKFTVANNFLNAHEVFCFDVDRDNDMDILGASSNLNRIAWWRNDGGDTIVWTEQILSSSVTLAKSVTAGDMDGDMDIDIMGVSIANNDVIWWRNDGGDPIQWTQSLVDGNFVGAHRVQAVDIDGDTDLDILGAAYVGHQIAWWRNDGGDPLVWSKQVIGSSFTNACIAYSVDLDGDNDKDVIGTGQGLNQIAWWRNDGGDPVQWTKYVISNNFTRPWPLVADTIDDDQSIDIVVGSSHNGSNLIKWWRNDGVSGINDEQFTPSEFRLFQNHPNPFNPTTKIKYQIPKQSFVTLKVYDVLGNEIVTLVNEEKSAGEYEINFKANELPSGIYFYKLTAHNFTKIRKMLLIK
jgi:hypothetical protein